MHILEDTKEENMDARSFLKRWEFPLHWTFFIAVADRRAVSIEAVKGIISLVCVYPLNPL